MSDEAERALTEGIRNTVASLEAEHAAATAVRHRARGPARHPAAEAALRCQAASHILACSLRKFMREQAFQVRAADALELMLAAIDWWDTYDAEVFLVAGATVDKATLREILESGGGVWREGMDIAEIRAECHEALHRRRGKR